MQEREGREGAERREEWGQRGVAGGGNERMGKEREGRGERRGGDQRDTFYFNFFLLLVLDSSLQGAWSEPV